jgi:hypothetical protein
VAKGTGGEIVGSMEKDAVGLTCVTVHHLERTSANSIMEVDVGSLQVWQSEC